jgi:hypothetical protein
MLNKLSMLVNIHVYINVYLRVNIHVYNSVTNMLVHFNQHIYVFSKL